MVYHSSVSVSIDTVLMPQLLYNVPQNSTVQCVMEVVSHNGMNTVRACTYRWRRELFAFVGAIVLL